MASSALLLSDGHTVYLSDGLLIAAMKRLVQFLTDPALTPKMLATAFAPVRNGKKKKKKEKKIKN